MMWEKTLDEKQFYGSPRNPRLKIQYQLLQVVIMQVGARVYVKELSLDYFISFFQIIFILNTSGYEWKTNLSNYDYVML